MTQRNSKDSTRSSSSSPPSSPPASRPARRRLGRGLSSLISSPVPVPSQTADDEPTEVPAAGQPAPADRRGATTSESPPDAANASTGMLQMVSVDAIRPNPHQPRQQFDEAGLESLATSIKSAGVMQPIILRPGTKQIDTHQYEIVAGERRWRAAKLAGLDHVPAVVRAIDDATAAEWALIENIQREDLNPIERAEAFRRLCEDFDLTHHEIAERVGLDRSSVTNLLRLLELDPESIEDVRAGRLTLGHARALLGITNISARRSVARAAAQQGWSVRELERRIKSRARREPSDDRTTTEPSPAEIHLKHLADELGQHLGTRVRIEPGRKKGAGKLVIDFYSLDDFESLLNRLGYAPS